MRDLLEAKHLLPTGALEQRRDVERQHKMQHRGIHRYFQMMLIAAPVQSLSQSRGLLSCPEGDLNLPANTA